MVRGRHEVIQLHPGLMEKTLGPQGVRYTVHIDDPLPCSDAQAFTCTGVYCPDDTFRHTFNHSPLFGRVGGPKGSTPSSPGTALGHIFVKNFGMDRRSLTHTRTTSTILVEEYICSLAT